jgi:hypothetical protein
LEKKRLEKEQWDLREAALAAVILVSGVWMIIAGLMVSLRQGGMAHIVFLPALCCRDTLHHIRIFL